MYFLFIINFLIVYYKRYQSLLKTIFFVFRKWIKCFAQKYKQNRAIIVRLLPYIISILILKYISRNVVYVSIFLITFILFMPFLFSKIQHKKSFVKYFTGKADILTLYPAFSCAKQLSVLPPKQDSVRRFPYSSALLCLHSFRSLLR